MAEGKPVTLFLGPNGSGKTGFLNTFTWCLYEQFTAGFDEHDKLIHDLAVTQGGSVYAEVDLVFVEDNDEFTVTRRLNLGESYSRPVAKRKPGPGKSRAGETLPVSIEDIYGILPKSLMEVFFLSAESLGTLSITDSSTARGGIDLRKAMESLLGLRIYAQASQNLNAAINADFLKLPSSGRDQAIESSKQKWEDAKTEVRELKLRRSEFPDLVAKAEAHLQEAGENASQYHQEAIEAWMKERDRLRDNVEAARLAVEESVGLLAEVLRDTQYAMFASTGFGDAVAP